MANKKSTRKQRRQPINYPGQHFMHNKSIIREMIQLARVSKDDTVIDIGAGKGAVTTLLAQKADKVIAIEYDRDLVDVLRSKTVACNNVKVIHRDIMITHLPRHNYLVVANIPYSITTSIMKKLLNNPMSGLQRAVIV